MFFVDMFLACLPMLNANRIHGLWVAVIVYLVALASLRSADNWAVRNGWKWRRFSLKILVLVIVDGAVLLSGLEQCDLAQTSCRRVLF